MTLDRLKADVSSALEMELEVCFQMFSAPCVTCSFAFLKDICTGRLREKILSLEHYYCKAAGAQAMLEPLSEPVGSTVARELLRNSTSGSVATRLATLSFPTGLRPLFGPFQL